MSRNFQLVWVVLIAIVFWHIGEENGRRHEQQAIVSKLTAIPLGSEVVGLQPIQDISLLKQIEVSVDGVTRKFAVGEIQSFDVSRYGPKGKSELLTDSNGNATARIVRATGMNKSISFTKPDDCYRSRTCMGMDPMAVYTSDDRDLQYVKYQDLRRDMEHIENYGLRQ